MTAWLSFQASRAPLARGWPIEPAWLRAAVRSRVARKAQTDPKRIRYRRCMPRTSPARPESKPASYCWSPASYSGLLPDEGVDLEGDIQRISALLLRGGRLQVLDNQKPRRFVEQIHELRQVGIRSFEAHLGSQHLHILAAFDPLAVELRRSHFDTRLFGR